MPELGEVDREFFDEQIHPNLGAPRDDVSVGPRHGGDFGAIAVGGQSVVLATDPFWAAFEGSAERLAARERAGEGEA